MAATTLMIVKGRGDRGWLRWWRVRVTLVVVAVGCGSRGGGSNGGRCS